MRERERVRVREDGDWAREMEEGEIGSHWLLLRRFSLHPNPVQVKEFVLLGHSLGGYLATAYTIRYPQRVSHLVLVDPWGFPEPPDKEEVMERFTRFQRFTWQALSRLRPFTAVRVAGPWGE